MNADEFCSFLIHITVSFCMDNLEALEAINITLMLNCTKMSHIKTEGSAWSNALVEIHERSES